MGHPGRMGSGTDGTWDVWELGTGTDGTWDIWELGPGTDWDTGHGTWDMGHGTRDMGPGTGHPGPDKCKNLAQKLCTVAENTKI